MKLHTFGISIIVTLVGVISVVLAINSHPNIPTNPLEPPPNQVVNTPEIDLENYLPEKPKFSFSTFSPTIIYTPPPNIPARAEKSGHCTFEIKVDAEGKVDDVLSLECSDEIYIRATKHSLLKWQFTPMTDENNQATSFKYGPTKIVYRLTDINGEIIPE